MTNLSKAEKRLLKRNQKLVKQQEKNVRLSGGVTITDKFIRVDSTPSLSKTPKVLSPSNYTECYFTWCHSKADIDGAWSWVNNEPRAWSQAEAQSVIEPHMNNLINKSWSEVEQESYNGKKKFRKLRNKYQDLSSICDEAQKRWKVLNDLNQFEELFRLRLGTNKRVWGIRLQHHFFMVWYERYHKICPIKD